LAGTGIVLWAAIFLSGCIQPVSVANQTKTAQAPFQTPVQGQPPVIPTTAPGAAASTPIPVALMMVQQFIASRGESPRDLQVWYDQALGPDRMQGFSYINLAGLPCAGFLVTATVGGLTQPINGGQACAPLPDTPAVASVTFFLTSDGQAYTVVFGRVQDPTISAIAVDYGDGSNQPYNPFMGGFLLVKAGVQSVITIAAINAQGFTVIDNIPQTPTT
jgi:hypothetical protein